MSGILIIIVVIVFVALLSGDKGNSKRPTRNMRSTRPRNFISYYDSLPEDSQTGFMDHLDDIQRLQFIEMLEHRNENMDVPQDLIDNFNDWTQSDEDKNISPYDPPSSFDNFDSSSYNSSWDSSSSDDYSNSDSSSWSDSCSGDSSSWSDSSSSWSDSSSSYSDSSSSFSDSGSSDCGGGGSDF